MTNPEHEQVHYTPRAFREDQTLRLTYDRLLRKNLEAASLLALIALIWPAKVVYDLIFGGVSLSRAVLIGMPVSSVILLLLALGYYMGWIGGKDPLAKETRHEVILEQKHLTWRYLKEGKRGRKSWVVTRVPYYSVSELEVWRDDKEGVEFLVIRGPAYPQVTQVESWADEQSAPGFTDAQEEGETEIEHSTLIPLLFEEVDAFKTQLSERTRKPLTAVDKPLSQVQQATLKELGHTKKRYQGQ